MVKDETYSLEILRLPKDLDKDLAEDMLTAKVGYIRTVCSSANGAIKKIFHATGLHGAP